MGFFYIVYEAMLVAIFEGRSFSLIEGTVSSPTYLCFAILKAGENKRASNVMNQKTVNKTLNDGWTLERN